MVSADDIIALERKALERWANGDPDGDLSTMAADVTYFDPTTERRIDGHDALRAMLDTIRGKVAIARSELLNPAVVVNGDTGLLTFDLVSHGRQFASGPKADARWNCSEVYRNIDAHWLIVHSQWSFTRPQVAQPDV